MCDGEKQRKHKKFCDKCINLCGDCKIAPKVWHTRGTTTGRCGPCSSINRARLKGVDTTPWPCRQCWALIAYGGKRAEICKDCAPNATSLRRVVRYSVDTRMFNAMYFEQNGKCGVRVCTREATAVDHCHKTNRVRGILCFGCNSALGYIEKLDWLSAVDSYLEEGAYVEA